LLSTIKIFLSRAKVYSLWVIVGVLSICLATLALVVRSKSKSIKELQTQLALKTARLELEQVLLKYQATLDEIKELRNKDSQIGQELVVIETQLSKKLSEDLTAEEIAAKFREIGIQ
jgi:hypothetical protein